METSINITFSKKEIIDFIRLVQFSYHSDSEYKLHDIERKVLKGAISEIGLLELYKSCTTLDKNDKISIDSIYNFSIPFEEYIPDLTKERTKANKQLNQELKQTKLNL